MRTATHRLRPFHAPARASFALLAALLLAWQLVSATALAAPADAAPGRVLTIGCITLTPREYFLPLHRMGAWLAADCADLGVTGARVLFTTNTADMVAAFAENRVDVISETLFGAIDLIDLGGAMPILLERREGVRRYHTVFFVPLTSTVDGLDGLRGKTLALEDPDSTSSGILPRLLLAERGIPTEDLGTWKHNHRLPSPDATGCLYVYDERNVAVAVRNGEADAGAMSDVDWNNPEYVPAVLRHALRVIHTSFAVPRSYLLVRANLPEPLRRRIAASFLQVAHDPERLRALEDFHSTDGYAPLREDDLRALDRARQRLSEPSVPADER